MTNNSQQEKYTKEVVNLLKHLPQRKESEQFVLVIWQMIVEYLE